jgi:hypothetical protein
MNDPIARTTGEDRTMSTHIFGLTVAALADASLAARTAKQVSR